MLSVAVFAELASSSLEILANLEGDALRTFNTRKEGKEKGAKEEGASQCM